MINIYKDHTGIYRYGNFSWMRTLERRIYQDEYYFRISNDARNKFWINYWGVNIKGIE